MELGAAVAHGVTNMNNLRSLWGGHLAELGGYSGSEADEWQRHGRVLFMVMLVVLVLVLVPVLVLVLLQVQVQIRS